MILEASSLEDERGYHCDMASLTESTVGTQASLGGSGLSAGLNFMPRVDVRYIHYERIRDTWGKFWGKENVFG